MGTLIHYMLDILEEPVVPYASLNDPNFLLRKDNVRPHTADVV